MGCPDFKAVGLHSHLFPSMAFQTFTYTHLPEAVLRLYEGPMLCRKTWT